METAFAYEIEPAPAFEIVVDGTTALFFALVIVDDDMASGDQTRDDPLKERPHRSVFAAIQVRERDLAFGGDRPERSLMD